MKIEFHKDTHGSVKVISPNIVGPNSMYTKNYMTVDRWRRPLLLFTHPSHDSTHEQSCAAVLQLFCVALSGLCSAGLDYCSTPR